MESDSYLKNFESTKNISIYGIFCRNVDKLIFAVTVQNYFSDIFILNTCFNSTHFITLTLKVIG